MKNGPVTVSLSLESVGALRAMVRIEIMRVEQWLRVHRGSATPHSRWNSVRFRKLVSTDRYGHVAVEMEAQLEAGEHPEAALDALRARVEAQLHVASERDRLYAKLHELTDQVAYLERQRDGLREDVATNRTIIRAHSELGSIARQRGIDLDGLNGEIPF